MEKHTNKKFAGLLAIACAFALGGCDPIESLPANYNDPILTYLTDNNAVATNDNIMGEIYNKISSDKNNKVLQIVLDELAERKFGTYSEIEEAHKNAQGSEKTAYIDAHAEFFKRESDTSTDAETRFDKFYDDVMERVSEAFYNLITSGSYNDKNSGMFSEEKLYNELNKDFWDLQPKDAVTFKKYFVTKELTKENATNAEHLNISLYSNSEAGKRGYIEKKVFPQILKDKLVEQYVFDNNYDSLGRSYGRNVNYVKVSYNDDNKEYINQLMNYFATNKISHVAAKNEGAIDFSMLQQAVNGFEKVDPNGAYLISMGDYGAYSSDNDAHKFNESYNGFSKKDAVTVTINNDNKKYFTTIDDLKIFNFDTLPVDYTFYGDTKLGDLMDSYKKAIAADEAGELYADPDDKAELDNFNGNKSLADSLKEKILALGKEENVTDGWYVKNGGISDLPSALRDRLFNINVANDLDLAYADGGYFEEDYNAQPQSTLGDYRFLEGKHNGTELTKVPYVRNVNGMKLIMASNAKDFNVDENNFVYSDGSAYYICQVLEAPNAPKLRESNENSNYTKVEKEEIARSIAKVLSTKDTYVTNAYTEYLEEYKFSFNDSSLYDYFKGQYPDLFEDED